jgi:hypothetical protein
VIAKCTGTFDQLLLGEARFRWLDDVASRDSH